MSDLNHTIIIGRLTRDPETKQAGQTNLTAFSVAASRTYTTQGEKREETLFMDCTAWGRLADIVKQYTRKGERVAVGGRLKQDTWKNQEGKTQSRISLVVESFQMLSPKGETGGAPAQSPQAPPPQPMSEDDIPF